jgi:hypothetical protein
MVLGIGRKPILTPALSLKERVFRPKARRRAILEIAG